MALTARSSKFRFAMGKQSVEGTAVTTCPYEYSVYSGSIKPMNTEVDFNPNDITDMVRGSYIQSAGWEGNPVINTDEDALGLPFLLHFGASSDTITGANPYTHTYARSVTPVFGTFYELRPDIVGGTDIWDQGTDGFVKSIEISAAKGDPVTAALGIIGKTYKTNVTAPTITTAKKVSSTAGWLSMIGATLKLDIASTPGTTVVHSPESFTAKFEYPNAVWMQTDLVTGTYLDQGEWRCSGAASLIFESFAHYNATFFGAIAPGASAPLSSVVVMGSLDFTFPGIFGATHFLQLKVPNVRFRVAPMEPDSGGGALKYSVTWDLRATGAIGTECQPIIVNATTPAY